MQLENSSRLGKLNDRDPDPHVRIVLARRAAWEEANGLERKLKMEDRPVNSFNQSQPQTDWDLKGL